MSGRDPNGSDADGVRMGLREANDFVRKVVGEIAFELATTPEGRAVGLSVEVWPDRGVGLRVHEGHELRVFAEVREGIVVIAWERSDCGAQGRRVLTSQGSLGEAKPLDTEDLRTFMARWLTWRTRG